MKLFKKGASDQNQEPHCEEGHSREPAPQGERRHPEDAREGYRAALQMIGTESKAIWDSFRSLLAANTVLIGLAGAVIKFLPAEAWVTAVLAILGMVISVAWILITARTFDTFKYWFAWARCYEKDALNSEQNMIQLGRRFSDGKTVQGLDSILRMRWVSRRFRVEWLLYVIILAFFFVYLGLLLVAISLRVAHLGV